jgi:hypothetical protein
VFGVEAETTERAEYRELGRVRDASRKGRALLKEVIPDENEA